MNKRDVKHLKVGNTIELMYNRGKGLVRKIVMTPEENVGVLGTYPMILFNDEVTHQDVWCTYKIIKPRPRSI